MKASNQVRIYRRARLLPLLAVPILFVSAGCASGGLGGGGGLSFSGPEGATAHIENNNWSDMKIYLVINGVRLRRLTTLGTLETRTVKIPRGILHSGLGFQFEAKAFGSGDSVMTPVIYAMAGDEIFWTVESHLAISIATMQIR